MIQVARGNPSKDLIPYQKIAEASYFVTEKAQFSLNQYLSPEGFLPLRETLASEHKCSVEQVFLGNGAIDVLSLLVDAIVCEQDYIFTESPSYDIGLKIFSRKTPRLCGLKLDADGLDIQLLKTKLKSKCPLLIYVIPDFQNPTGVTLSLYRRKALIELAEKYGFWLVEDAAYRRLRYKGEELPSLFELAPHKVIHIGSFSKTIAPGLRVGYLVGSTKIIETLSKHALIRHIFPNTYSQAIVHHLIQNGTFYDHLLELKKEYGTRLQVMLEALEKWMPASVTWSMASGGFFIGLFSNLQIEFTELCQLAKKNQLALLDGSMFFLDVDVNKLFIRLTFAGLTPCEIKTAIKHLSILMAQIS